MFCTPLVSSYGILILHLVFFHKQLQYPVYCLSLLHIELCAPRPPPNSYIETLNPNVTVFGDRAIEEVIKVTELTGEA